MNWKKGIALSLVATMAFAGLTGCTDSPYAPDDVTPQNHNSASALVHPGDFASTLSNGIYIMQIKNSAISDNPITLITIKDTSFREGYFGQDMVDDSYIPNRPADAGNSSVSVWNIMDDSVLGIAGQGINRISIPAERLGGTQDMNLLLNFDDDFEKGFLSVIHLPNTQTAPITAPAPQ